MAPRLRTFLLGAGMLAGCASPTGGPSIPATAPGGQSERVPTTVSSPDGSGPFPAIVILHDCSGLGVASSGAPQRWSKELVSRGYVVVIPDSFTTRGRPRGVCTDASPGQDVSPARRVRDAYAALAHARTLPSVDGRRVGLMGGSHGGSTTLLSMLAPDGESDLLASEKRTGFRAAVALYPRCGTRSGGRAGPYRPVAPLLILIGEKDDWTPAEACQRLADDARAAGYAITIKVYPDAHHAFDSDRPIRFVAARVNPASPTGRGATTGGNPAAWTASIRDVLAFFAEHLK